MKQYLDALKKRLARMGESRDARLTTEFLPEALEIVEKPPSPLGHFVVWTVVLILAAALLWSVVGRVDEVAVARGKVVSVSSLQIVQPVAEGKIAEFYVQEGSSVTAGQKLVRLDSTLSAIQLDNAQKNLEALEAKNGLLQCFVSGGDVSAFFHRTYPEMDRQVLEYVVSLQEDYLNKEQQCKLDLSQADEALRIQQQELQKTEEALSALQSQRDSLVRINDSVEPDEQLLLQMEEQIAFAEKEERDCRELYEGGAIPKHDWLVKQNELVALQGQYQVQERKIEYENEQKKIQLNQVGSQISEAENNLVIRQKMVRQAQDKLEQSKTALDELKTETEKAVGSTLVENSLQISNIQSDVRTIEEQIGMETLYSPVDGVVQSLALKTVGGVVTPAQPLISIAPSGTQVVVEASLLNKDIGFVRCGQKASVKMDTFPFQQYGTAEGTVVFISPDSERNDQNQLLYKIRVALDSERLQGNGRDSLIASGMEGTVEIKTGKRRIIEFFLDPFIKNLDESLKVR